MKELLEQSRALRREGLPQPMPPARPLETLDERPATGGGTKGMPGSATGSSEATSGEGQELLRFLEPDEVNSRFTVPLSALICVCVWRWSFLNAERLRPKHAPRVDFASSPSCRSAPNASSSRRTPSAAASASRTPTDLPPPRPAPGEPLYPNGSTQTDLPPRVSFA